MESYINSAVRTEKLAKILVLKFAISACVLYANQILQHVTFERLVNET